MALAAYIELAEIPLVRQDWMDDEDWKIQHTDRLQEWPNNTRFYYGAEAFRRCARAALAAYRAEQEKA